MVKEVKFDKDRKRLFLDEYAKTALRYHSADAVGVCWQTVANHLQDDEEFAEQFKEAKARFVEHLEDVVYKRSVEGTKKPIFYKGVPVGEITEYDHKLLEMRLKAEDKEKYRENHKIDLDANLKGGVLVVPGLASSPEDWAEKYGSTPVENKSEDEKGIKRGS